jgi:hypothetical protein
MQTNTGRIVEVPKGSAAPHGSVPLGAQEARELKMIPDLGKTYNRARLRRYKQMHADDDCRSCGKKLRGHTLRQFQTCYSE